MNQTLNCQKTILSVSSALSPKTWPFSLEWLPDSACLVGGSVRDALLQRDSEYLDLDFVLPARAVETAQAIARHYKAGYVLLDAERQIARVVFKQGTADFAQQVGPCLESDLKRRDFTVNAIAYNPHTDQLLDPLQGYADLQRRTIRMVSHDNLQEDPLRLLRAYRQAAQLGFTVDDATRSAVRQLARGLRRIAAERVQSELNYLLSTARGSVWLTAAWSDGLLQDWLPDTTPQSLRRVAAIDQATVMLQETLPALATELISPLRTTLKSTTSGPQGAVKLPDVQASGSIRTWLTTAKLASLLPSDPAQAEAQLRRLKYSRTEIQAVNILLKFLPYLSQAVGDSDGSDKRQIPADQTPEDQAAINNEGKARMEGHLSSPGSLSAREQYLFFQSVGLAFPAIAVLALASGVSLSAIAPLIDHFLTPHDPIAHPSPLLTGQDLMTALKLPAGPHIGRLLAEIQLARAEGKVATAAEALELARLLNAEG